MDHTHASYTRIFCGQRAVGKFKGQSLHPQEASSLSLRLRNQEFAQKEQAEQISIKNVCEWVTNMKSSRNAINFM